MKRTLISATLAASGIAFAAANEGGKNATATPPAPPAPAAATTATAKPAKVKAVVLGITNAVAKPESTSSSKSNYPFDKLEVGQSFGVQNRDKKSFNSIIYMAHKRFATDILGADGQPEKERKVARDGTAEMVNKTVRTREFEAFDVDPKTDPEGASVRIFRNK